MWMFERSESPRGVKGIVYMTATEYPDCKNKHETESKRQKKFIIYKFSSRCQAIIGMSSQVVKEINSCPLLKAPGLANQLRITDRITKVAYHFERLS